MPRFEYIALNAAKKTEKGTVTAENAYAARKQLRARGLHPVRLDAVRLETVSGGWRAIFDKSAKKDVADLTRQLATLLNAGIKLTEALSVLIGQVSNPRLRAAVTEIRDRVVTGESLADAMSEYEAFFDVVFISMIRVGEITGTLPNTLTTLSTMIEKRQRLDAKLTTVMLYPAVLMVVCVAVVLVIMTVVIPRIAEQLVKTGQQLPALTRGLIALSNMLTSGWSIVLLAGLVALVWLIRRLLTTERGARWKDKTLLRLPGFGALIKQRILARFSSTLAVLLGAGLSMAESLRVVAQVTGNTVMADAIKTARERILSGADITTPLRDSGVIDPTIAHMVAVGEKSGELEQMLRLISENLEAHSDLVIERLSALIEPVIIILMAIIIGIIAYATLMPLFQYSVTQF